MNLYHDPGECAHPMCSLCRSHGEGYARGKDAAYSEIRARLTDTSHAPDCGDEACLIIRAARSSGPARRRVRVRESAVTPDDEPEDTIAAPETGSSVTVEKICADCKYPFIAPASDPHIEQCEIHRAFGQTRRRFAEPRGSL